MYIMMLFSNTRQALSPCGPAIGAFITTRLPVVSPMLESRPAVSMPIANLPLFHWLFWLSPV